MNSSRSSSLIVAAIAILVAPLGFTSDFRVLDFNASCENIAALEVARGAKPFEGRLPSGYHFAFHIREMDRDAVVGYSCKDGKFFRGAYIFDVSNGDEATQLYTAIKRKVTSEFGAPSYDFASAEHLRKMRAVGAELSRSDTQVAFWNDKHSEAHASVAEPARERGWQVSLSYTVMSALAD